MVVPDALLVIPATPAATTPPVGNACAAALKASTRQTDKVLIANCAVPGTFACLFFKLVSMRFLVRPKMLGQVCNWLSQIAQN